MGIPVSKLKVESEFITPENLEEALSDVLGIGENEQIVGVGHDGEKYIFEIARKR